MKVLIECGLINVTQKGRERYCEAKLEKLDEVAQWVEQYRLIWQQKHDRLDRILIKLTDKKKKNEHTKSDYRRGRKGKQEMYMTREFEAPVEVVFKAHDAFCILALSTVFIFRLGDANYQFIVLTNIDAKPEMTLTMEVLDCNNNIDAALEEYIYLQTIGPDLGDKFMKLFEEIRADDKIIETTMLVNPF